jgi:hypothetical protein
MHFFNNNLIRPSSYVGLHPQLVAYDANRHDGVQVGTTDDFDEEFQLAPPGGTKEYRWYAGDISFVNHGVCESATTTVKGKGKGGGNNQGVTSCVTLVATPVEFGGVNLLSADRVKQPQKGLFGALSILPAGSKVNAGLDGIEGTEDDDPTLVPDGQGTTATRLTRAQVTVTAPEGPAGSGGTFRENLLIGHKIANPRWKDGTAIRNIAQGELGIEGAEDAQAAARCAVG